MLLTKLPLGQLVQFTAPGLAANVPTAQPVATDMPVDGHDDPAGHGEHDDMTRNGANEAAEQSGAVDVLAVGQNLP